MTGAREAAVRVLQSWSAEHTQWGGPRRTAEQVANELADLTPEVAAREAAVEAVAREMCRQKGYDWETQASGLSRKMLRNYARELLSLPEVRALSSAPGQEQGR